MEGKLSEETKPQDQMTIRFEHAPHYRMHPSNGAWGGVTPRGDFMIEFYVERVKPPSRVTHATDGKTVGAEIRRDPPDGIVREFQVGVLLSQGEALALANFIKQKTEDFAKLTAVDSEKKTK